jgi:hypothetical protein
MGYVCRNVTFPTEAKVSSKGSVRWYRVADDIYEQFSDAQYARRTYESVVQRTINAGTSSSPPSFSISSLSYDSSDLLLLRNDPPDDQDPCRHLSPERPTRLRRKVQHGPRIRAQLHGILICQEHRGHEGVRQVREDSLCIADRHCGTRRTATAHDVDSSHLAHRNWQHLHRLSLHLPTLDLGCRRRGPPHSASQSNIESVERERREAREEHVLQDVPRPANPHSPIRHLLHR